MTQPDFGEDRHLPDRLAALGFIIEGEDRLYREYLHSVTRWLDYMRPRVFSGMEQWRAVDTLAIRGSTLRWVAEIAQFLSRGIAWIINRAFQRVLGYEEPAFTNRPWVQGHLADVQNRMVRTPDWLFNQVRAQMDVGLSGGEGIYELSNRIEDTLFEADAETWRNRAQTVARTEAISAYNGGTDDAFALLGETLGVPLEKVWLASMDTRTRDTHFAADGQRVPMRGQFIVGAGHFADYPGDPSLPASERINCRCSVLYVEPGEDTDVSNRGMRGDKAERAVVAERAARGIIRARDN